MGLQTIHKNPKDIVSVYNQTQDTWFKCELVDDVKSEKIRLSLGLDLPSVTMTLKVNGHAECKENDKLRLLNQTLLVRKTATKFDNTLQFRKRADYGYFNSTEYIFLE